MAVQTDLIAGLANFLAANSVGVWNPDGAPVATGEVGIYDSNIPAVDRLVTLTPYPLTDDATLSDSYIGVQVRVRMPGPDPRPARDLVDEVFDLLQNVTHLDLSSGIQLVSLTRTSAAPLGYADDCWNWTSNYAALIHYPTSRRQ